MNNKILSYKDTTFLQLGSFPKGANSQRPALDTLVYVPPRPKISSKKAFLDLPKKDKTEGKPLQKRARSKWYTRGVIAGMLYLNSPIHKYYQRAYFCNNILQQEGKKIKASYCNTRVCNVCNRIRTAKLINGYMAQLNKMELEFVTLTLPNCSANELRNLVERMQKESTNIIRNLREKKKLRPSGIRKLEITYNNTADTYHPHFHFIVEKGFGKILIDEWLKRFATSKRIAQDCKQADKNSLNELFKYTTKIVGQKEGNLIVYRNALDTILRALRGKRCFQPFGDIRKVSEEVSDELQGVEYEGIPEYEFMQWNWIKNDWINDYGEILADYKPPEISFLHR